MPDCHITPLAGDADLEGVMSIDRESFSAPWTREMYAGELADPAVAFVAVVRTPDYPVAGYCSYRLVVDEIHINNVAVRAAARRQGLGRQLVQHVLGEARSKRLNRVLLEVRSRNEPARQLYEKMGFTVIGRRRGYYGEPPDDALVLARDLQDFESDPSA